MEIKIPLGLQIKLWYQRVQRIPKEFWSKLAFLFGIADFLSWTLFYDLSRDKRLWLTISLVILSIIFAVVTVWRNMPVDEKLEKARFLYREARNEYNKNKFNAAYNLLKAAIEIDPDSASINGLLGRVLLRLGKPNESILYLSKAKEITRIESSRRLLLKNRGIAYLLLGNYGEALKDFVSCFKSDSKDFMAYRLAGLTWLYLDDIDKAMSMIKKALSIFPNYPCAHATKSILHWKRGEKDLAKKEIKKAERITNFNASDLYCIAAAYSVLEDQDKSLSLLQIAIQQNIRYYYWAHHDPFLKGIVEKIDEANIFTYNDQRNT